MQQKHKKQRQDCMNYNFTFICRDFGSQCNNVNINATFAA